MFAESGFSHNWRFLLVLILFGLSFGTQGLAQPAELQPENELLLELRLDGKPLGLDILGYQRGEEFLLSLDELSSALGFSITVDSTNGAASGWYISEEREFSLDLTRANVISGGNNWPLMDGEVVLFQGGLYVDATAIQKWFPLTLSTVVRELYLDIESTELLPIQKRMNRRSRVVSESTTSYQEPQYPPQDIPYQFLGPHTTNLRFGYSTTRESFDSNAQYSTNFVSLSRGDLGWMTSTFSLAGRSENSLTAARLKLERTAFNGPLGLNHFEVGDVDAGGFRGTLLRGNSGGDTNDKRPDNEFVTIEGSQLPDWDVELYQNNQLISLQTTGLDGRYLFEDISLQFGENRFELKFFGPNGEVESREEFYYLGPDMLAPGHLSYQLSAVQNGHTVFGVSDNTETLDQGSGIYASSINFGLSPNLTIGGKVSSRESNGERLSSGSLNLGFSTSLLYGSLRYAAASAGQNSVSTSLRTRLRNTSVSFDFTRFFEELLFVNEQYEVVTTTKKWDSSIDVTSSFYNIPIKFEASVQEREFTTSREAALGTTVPLRGAGYFSSSIWVSTNEEHVDGIQTNSSTAGGQSSFNTTLRPWTFRLAAIYGFKPDAELRQLSANSSLRIDSNLSMTLGVRQSSTTDTVSYDGGINWLHELLTIGTRVSYDSDERWTGLITLGTTLVNQPRTLIPRVDRKASVNSGTVEVRVFENVDDAEQHPYTDAGVNTVQTWRKATTDTEGKAYLSGMPAHRRVDIELDESTLKDYELRSTNPGVSITSRPGSYAVVNFPLVRTAELEGYIKVAVNGGQMPVSRALVFLKLPDGEVVTQTRTAFDGFFLFEGIEPGDYQISLESPLEKRVLKRPTKVTVASNSGVIGGLDYTLSPVNAEIVAAPTMFAQEDESKQDTADPSDTLSLPTLSAALPGLETETSPLNPAEPQTTQPETTQPETTQQNNLQEDNGNWFVQIGAYDSRDMAQTSWDRLSQSMQALQGKIARFMPYQSMTRLLVGPGKTRDAANTLCEQLKADDLDCMVRRVEE